MDDRVLGLGIALGYPEEAFRYLPVSVLEEAKELVRRAGAGEPVDAELAAFLDEQLELSEWIEQLMEDPDLRPPHLKGAGDRAYSQLGSRRPSPVSATRYVCVKNVKHTWYRPSVGFRVPACMICGGELVPASR